MSAIKRFAFLSIFMVSSLYARQQSLCEKQVEVQKTKIKQSFDQLWFNVDNKVGVEFFMVVLKGNNRMPSSEMSQAQYYQQLLNGMKRTSRELADHGQLLDPKKVKVLEAMIKDLSKMSSCSSIVAR
jgi:hypothetical protein